MAPTTKNRSAISPWSMLGSPKLLTLFLSVLDIFQQSCFSNFQFLKKNIKRCQKYPKGGPFCEFQIFGVLARNSFFDGLKQHKYAFLGTDFGLYG